VLKTGRWCGPRRPRGVADSRDSRREELLESRAKQSTEDTYFEIDVFEEYGPWKASNHRYSNT